MNRPEEIWGDWSGTDEDQSLDPLIDPSVWGSVEDMTDESLADHLEQRAKMLDQRRPGPEMLREAAARLRRGEGGGGRTTHTIACSECGATVTLYVDEPSIDLSAMEYGWRFNTEEGWTCPEHGSWPGAEHPSTGDGDDGE